MGLSPGLLLIVLFGIGAAAFWLGYDVSETRERDDKAVLDKNLKLVIQQKQELSKWVRQNWPDEYAAYQKGHTEGYRQGVLHSPALEDDTA